MFSTLSSPKREHGQAIALVAIAMVGLLAIVGLLVDLGVYLNEYSRLKRAVDAGAISAALQIREGYTITELSDIATQFIQLNASDATDLIIETCDIDPFSQTEGCQQQGGRPEKKLVRVTATKLVDFGFLPIIGIDNATITASAIGEAASVDAVLVIDSSASMAYEGGGRPDRPDDPADDPSQCNPSDSCQPFRDIKDVAENFVQNLYFPYDRVAVVTFDTDAHATQPLQSSKTAALSVIDNLRVFQPSRCDTAHGPCLNYDAGNNYVGTECPIFRQTGDPSSCGSSNIGAGLAMAGNLFANPPMREDALWVVILLAGGPANRSSAEDTQAHPYGYCPSSTWAQPPFCRDFLASTRHHSGDLEYDADDYARDMADYVKDPVNGQGAVIYSIGLGDLIWDAPGPAGADPDAGEQLLMYAAREAGGVNANHGKYYYAPDASELERIFTDIAENIATRLSQ